MFLLTVPIGLQSSGLAQLAVVVALAVLLIVADSMRTMPAWANLT